jgi:soluble lytic murein transglycosylase-like protein
MDANPMSEGQADKRAVPRLVPRQTVVLTVHDHQILPSYGVVNNITESGASIVNDHLLEAGRRVRLKLGLNEQAGVFETEARIVWSQNGHPIGALHGLEFTGLSEARRAELRELLVRSESFWTDEHRATSRWRTFALIGVALLLLVAAGAASIAFHHMRAINQRVESALAQVEQKTQQLDSGIRFDSRRQRLLLGIRDEIVRANQRIGLGEAYKYAQFVLRASEKYPSIDPLLFLAVGIVESGYNVSATSHASAAGLYQIQPTTGRLLARTLSWEYSLEMLYDPEKNTEMAALYLDILLSTHDDLELVLAEYNGGPRNAHYFRSGSSHLAEETRNYVPKVMNVYERLKNRFEVEEHQAEASKNAAPATTGTP